MSTEATFQEKVLQNTFNWRFVQSGAAAMHYEGSYQGVRVSLVVLDSFSGQETTTFARYRKKGRPSYFNTAQELFDSFPSVVIHGEDE